MKKKVGEIYNKPIVVGDTNLVTKNEIHINNISNSVGGGDINEKQINLFDLIKNPVFMCITQDSSTSSSLGFNDFIIGEGVPFIACTIYNGKKGSSLNMLNDISSNGFKGFPVYVMFDADVLLLNNTLGDIIAKLMKDYPGDGYYMTKEEFMDIYNKSTSL